jgi:DnaD/phage-associated family protein
MNIESVILNTGEVRKLLGAASADGALLYIYLRAGNPLEDAAQALNLPHARISCAMATLRQLGLWQEEKHQRILAGERPVYSERDVLEADSSDNEFKALRGEVERLLGRPLNTEELKIILGFIRYLGLPCDVIAVLICYCKDRARQRGSLRNPSLRTIEKEAYAWAEQGIDSLEEAAAFIQTQNVRASRMSRLQNQLQIRGRHLTAAEERYAQSWLEMGFEDDVITMAYERTCLNTGGLNWAYMNKILQRWHEAGLHTAEAIRTGDRKPGTGSQGSQRQLDADEQAAIARMLREG